MRKIYLAGAALAVALSGCSGQTQGDAQTSAASEPVVSESSEAEESKTEDTQTEVSFTEVPTGLPDVNGMVAYGTDLYFADGSALWRVNRETGEKTELMGAGGEDQVMDFCVHQGDVYAAVSNRWGSGSQIWLYKADTGEVSVLEGVGREDYSLNGMYALDGVLYLSYADGLKGYSIGEDGSLGAETAQDQLPYSFPSGYFVWSTNGFAPYAAAQGTDPILMASPSGDEASGALYRQDLETGELTELKGLSAGGYMPITADGQVFYGDKNGDFGILEAYDLETGQTREVYSMEEDLWIRPLEYRDGSIYCSAAKSESTGAGDSQTYLRINAKTGEAEVLAELTEEAGESEFQSLFYNPYFYADEGGSWYYETVEDGQQKLVKRELSEDDPWTDPVIKQSKIADVGTVTAWHKDVRSEDGSKTVLEAYVEQLTLDGTKPGDEAINGMMETQAKAKQQYSEQELLGNIDQEYVQREDFSPNTYSSAVIVTYDDGRYICVGYVGYEYPSGAAHGMPFKEYHVFDRQEGKELKLSDLISNTEEELKEIVSPYFEEPARAGATFDGPEEVASQVRERISYASDCYLTDDGLVFYFAPYDLGPYASGFIEVTVPFDQLMWKVQL